jgi:hypothetical protein
MKDTEHDDRSLVDEEVYGVGVRLDQAASYAIVDDRKSNRVLLD